MGTLWLWLVAVGAVCAGADRQGSSLRGALEALQRRQRSRGPGPIAPQPDYDALYEFFPPQAYADPDYGIDIDDKDEDPNPKYMFKLLDNDERPPEAYEYKIIKKKKLAEAPTKQESAFRERSHHSDNDRLRDLFIDRNEAEESKEVSDNHAANDAEYALLLGQLWTKYKNNKVHNEEVSPQGVVKLYKEKIVKKRYPENWGPIAFKKKRSSDSEANRPVLQDYEERRLSKPGSVDANYNSYEIPEDDKDDISEEYAIAFQPLDDDSLIDLGNDDQYNYETVEKRFPVTKRSSGSYNFGIQKKRFVSDQSKRDISKRFRSSSGTDPRILKDLSKIFGDSEGVMVKNPVKRSSDNQEGEHPEVKPPNLSIIHNNNTHEHSNVTFDDNSHEHHGHNLHHPGISGKEIEHIHNGDHNDNIHSHGHSHDHKENEHPIKLRKKSIDWSDYFGIDKRKKKSVSFVNNLTEERLKKQYFDTFNKEIVYPLNSFRQHNNVKRNYGPAKSNEDTEIQIDRARAIAIHDDDKKRGGSDNDSKLDNIDKKLRNMEDLIVDEALHYSSVGEKLDSKEEQEMKEKLLSRLAAAYSLEKMRKALKEFKQSLQTQKSEPVLNSSPIPDDEMKAKRIAVKKDKADIMSNDIPMFQKGEENNGDFEEEQGAGHYLDGRVDEPISEGYMGGSGRHRFHAMPTEGATGSCPVLAKIVQRCRGVDMLAGDRGQLFLPLCSLHQICYLCGEAPPMTCDMVFLSEADTTCEGDTGCQRAARSALMALRELHDNLADEMDGECESNPCLPATLKLNIGWQRALQR